MNFMKFRDFKKFRYLKVKNIKSSETVIEAKSRKPKGLPRCRRGAKRAFRELRSGWCSFFRLTTKNQTYIIYKRNRAVNRLTVNSPIFFVYTPIRGWYRLYRRWCHGSWRVGHCLLSFKNYLKIRVVSLSLSNSSWATAWIWAAVISSTCS